MLNRKTHRGRRCGRLGIGLAILTPLRFTRLMRSVSNSGEVYRKA
jgi:hypothetical protein